MGTMTTKNVIIDQVEMIEEVQKELFKAYLLLKGTYIY